MSVDREYVDYLEDIADAADKIQAFIAGMDFEAFSGDDKTAYAVVRALEVIGEATKNVPDKIRRRHPDVPWRLMAGMRDKLIHGYFGVNWEVVWQTVVEDVPMLSRLIGEVLEVETD